MPGSWRNSYGVTISSRPITEKPEYIPCGLSRRYLTTVQDLTQVIRLCLGASFLELVAADRLGTTASTWRASLVGRVFSPGT